MNWPKHGDRRVGERYDRPSMAWISEQEWSDREWDRRERIFNKKANQGELCCPQLIRDNQGGINGVQSMVDGKHYDSKREMRKHYNREGVIEVGTEQPKGRYWHGNEPKLPEGYQKGVRKTIEKVFNRLEVPPA